MQGSAIKAALAAVGLMVSTAMPVQAQGWPDRIVTVVVPLGAGSGTDAVARIFVNELNAKFGQRFIVENRAGGSGTIGAAYAANAEPDGYTLLVGGTSSHASAMRLIKNVPYDPVADFTPVAAFGEYPYILLVNNDSPYTTVNELVEAAKTSSDPLTYGYGNAVGQLAGAMLTTTAGINVIEVPYTAAPAALTDLMGGHIDYMFSDFVAPRAQITAGTLRALAVGTPERSNLLPEVPTLSEEGLPFFTLAWSGLFAPAGTPDEIVATLSAAIAEISQSDALRDQLAAMGFELQQDHSGSFADYVQADIDLWAEYTTAAGIEPQ